MIAISPRSTERKWGTVSFASTLYLCPILDLLLTGIPSQWQAEVRLGLQEALVNAAKHGNKLDPRKKVLVRYSVAEDVHCWVISDQGGGFESPLSCATSSATDHSLETDECGRGLMILHQIFDQVQWSNQGTQLQLCKQVRGCTREPLIG